MTGPCSRLALLAAMVLVGCTPTTKQQILGADEREAMARRTVVLVRRELPVFGMYKTSDLYLQMATAPLGLAGIWATYGALMASASHRSEGFLSEHPLADPAVSIAGKLGRYFGPRLGVEFAGMTTAEFDTRDAQEIAGPLRGTADFALDVRTDYWGLTSSPLVSRYRFAYQASLVLIDLDSGTTLASGQCKYWPDSSVARSLDDLTDADSALLRQEIAAAVDGCAETFTDTILNRRVEPDEEAPP